MKDIIMIVIGLLLIYIAIKHRTEPSLLIPLGFGTILVNLPSSGAITQTMPGIGIVVGILDDLFTVGIAHSEALPLLLFIGLGAMLDFTPLLKRPFLLLIGLISQGGIFLTMFIAGKLGFSPADAASIGIIGAADGPTAILVANMLNSSYFAPITVVAYCYMALVPIISPIVLHLTTTKKERAIAMPYVEGKNIPFAIRILFPIVLTIISGLIAPASVSLVGMLAFGNLIKECLVLDSLKKCATDILTPLCTIFLGLAIATQMKADAFIRTETLLIMGLGVVAFALDIVCGVCFVKITNLFRAKDKKWNPLVGGAGISAFPMASRVVQKEGLKANCQNHLLPIALGANVAGQIGSVLAGGIILSLFV